MQTSRQAARFIPTTAKALECILWLANAQPDIDIYHIVKAVYFAEVEHLNQWGRPIVGDEYRADTYGPLGRTIYGLLRNDPLEQLALGSNGPLPFIIGPRWTVRAGRDANEAVLSESDVEALRHGLDHVREMSFDALVEETHGHLAYRRAAGARMRYEDLLDESGPSYQERLADLVANAASSVL